MDRYWRHRIVLEKVLRAEAQTKPRCLAGKRRCPPEDVGGPPGYQEFLRVMREPEHPQFQEFRELVGGDFDPEGFDPQAINEILEQMRCDAAPAIN